MNEEYITFDEATKTISIEADSLPLDIKDSWEHGAGYFGWTAERVSEPSLTEFYNFLQKYFVQEMEDAVHKTLIHELSKVAST